MSVIITPSEQLEFHRPFTQISKETIKIRNTSTTSIIFKIKTTAPKQYCVKPNNGRIEPNTEAEVQIILQPIKEDIPDGFKCRDKFLVQTAPVLENMESQDVTNLWNQIETEQKKSMQQHKIKCVFVTTDKKEIINEVSKVVKINEGSSTLAPPILTFTNTSLQESTSQKDILTSQLKSTTTNDIELKAALDKIKLLEKQLVEAKKEQENNLKSTKKLPSSVQPLDAVHQHLAKLEKHRSIEGYPPQVVIGVSLLVFIITFLFF